MSDIADYDTDILLWSERQAALLRDLKAQARQLPNELDLENVAEEIETVGRSELRAAESYLALIFEHLIKAANSSSSDPLPHWFAEIRTFRSSYMRAVTPSMRPRINLDRIWVSIGRDVSAGLEDIGEVPRPLPTTCPFALAELENDAFTPRGAMEKLRRLTSVEPSPEPPGRSGARRRIRGVSQK